MPTDAEIVHDVLRGDREAFAQLVARHERAVWLTAWRVLRDNHAASDAAQEAFLQAFRRLGSLRRPDLFGVWTLRITRREAIRLARLRSFETSRDTAIDAGLPGPVAAETTSADFDEDLLAAVAQLPEHERLVIALHYLDARPVAEVAAILDRPLGTVTKQLSRAIQRLRKISKEVFQ